MSGVLPGDIEWAWLPSRQEVVRVVERVDLWGQLAADVLSSSSDGLVRVAADELKAVAERPWTSAELQWRSAIALAGHLIASGEPISLTRCSFDPLPHQVTALQRAIQELPIRLLLADEVGLGKTLEAGLIWTELKARRLVKRVLIVAPAGLQLQWVAELGRHFGEEIVRVGRGGMALDGGIDPWANFDQVICSFDSIKPVRRRRGWDEDRLAAHNRLRFDAAVAAGWDLVIFDEAHHLAGNVEDVARHDLARALTQACPNVLLLSATPHSGKSDAFRRLLSLLDAAFLDGEVITRERVADRMIRTEKRAAVSNDGKPLFQPRASRLEVIPYGNRGIEETLYDAVTEYVRHGYARALRERRPIVALLVLLMQRLVSSSTAAIKRALERRLVAIVEEGTQLRLLPEQAEEWGDLTEDEELAALISAQGAAWENERAEVELLLDLARRAAAGVDAKASYLLELVRRLQREEGDPALKVLVFTQFVATQEMLIDMMERGGISAERLNGQMDLSDRALAQDRFSRDIQVLVSTDAGGEGVNLQFAHVVVNYDLPWNPMRIEQRIGRVDRIGQAHPVRAFNLVLENTIDQRVLEILEQKLDNILRELGIDKRTEVLEDVSSHVERLYAEAILHPEEMGRVAGVLDDQVREQVEEARPMAELVHSIGVEPTQKPDPRLGPLLAAANQAFASFSDQAPKVDQLDLLRRLPTVSPAEPVPSIRGFENGWWSLWEVRPSQEAPLRDFFSLFHQEGGGVRPDLASRIWEALARGTEVTSGEPPDSDVWAVLDRQGLDHAYGPYSRLAGKDPSAVPWVRLRLLVRAGP
jgi:superfamily II DNA or RNA helicase